MTNVQKLSVTQIQKAIQALNILSHTYALYSPTLSPDTSVATYYLSLAPQEWIVQIVINGNNYGSISKQANVMTIAFTGMFTNVFNFLDSLRLEFDENFYGIETFIGPAIRRMYNALHHQIQNILLTNHDIDSVQIVGFSYGTALAQAVGVLLYKIIQYNSGAICDAGENMIDALYANYFAPYFATKSKPTDPIFKAIKMESTLLQNKALITSMKTIDKGIFGRLKIDSIHAFSPLNVFTDTILLDNDLDLLKSVSSMIEGNLKIVKAISESHSAPKSEFFNLMFCYILPNDPIAGIIDPRTFLGKMTSFFTNSASRILLGQIVILKSTGITPVHEYSDYINSISKTLNTSGELRVYSYLNAPVTQPFPLLVLPYLGFELIQTKNIIYILIGIVMVAIGIVIPALLVLVVYNIIALFTGWPHILF